MTTATNKQWLRRVSLKVIGATQELDLSQMQFRFHVTQSNEESPNTAAIRVYNLSAATVKALTSTTPVEYKIVELKAGYQGSGAPFGTIFAGEIKQYRRGRESATDTYLDILSASDDTEYNFGTVSASVPKDTPKADIVALAAKSAGLEQGFVPDFSGGTLPRGKVLWGMSRAIIRNAAESEQMGWSIQDGKLVMVKLDSYLPGDIIVLNSSSGMVGIPEQTDEGVRVRCLLNPKLYIGGRMNINNADINQISQAGSDALLIGQVPYDQWAGLSLPADVSSDGYYMMYVIEHTGDTRGQEWYSDIIGLAMSGKEGQVKPYGS